MEVMTTSYILGTCVLFIIDHFLKELRPAVNGKTFGEKGVDLHEWTGAVQDVGRSRCCGCSVPAPQHLSLKLKARLKTPLTEDVLFWPQEQAGLEYRANGKCQRFKCGNGPQLKKYGDR